MAIILYVNNIPHKVPTTGEQAPWSEGLDTWHEEVTKVLNSLKGSSDILETGASIANNVSTPQDVTDLKFDAAKVRSFVVNGNITRLYDTSSKYEEFTLTGLKTDSGWKLQQEGVGDAEVAFSITNSGQVQYISSNLTVISSYSGLSKFRGQAVLQE